MKLKVVTNPAPEGEQPTKSVLVKSHPKSGCWNLGQATIDRGLSEGWMSISGGKITLHAPEGEQDVVYRIVAPPGHYCVHCGRQQGSSKEAEKHVAARHRGETLATRNEDGSLPDNLTQQMLDQINNPAGYAKFNCYRTVRES